MNTILVVDDNPVGLKLVRLLLGRTDYRLLEAVDAASALALLRHERPDLILLDILLPGELDGLALIRRLKTEPTTQALPVIALTALVMPEDLAAIRAAGFDGYLAKPLRIQAFLDEIARWLVRTPG